MDYVLLSSKEFDELTEKEKWHYVESLHRILKDLEIKAEKNCGECEKHLITADDVNIDLLFEDWRECSDHCDECNKEDKKNMCDLQFQLMSHLADSICVLREKLNTFIKLVLTKDDSGKKIVNIAKEIVKDNKNLYS